MNRQDFYNGWAVTYTDAKRFDPMPNTGHEIKVTLPHDFIIGKDSRVNVIIEGAGVLAGLGTGNPKSTDNYASSCCTLYQGRAMAIVRTTKEAGKIAVKILSDFGETEIELKSVIKEGADY